MAEGPERGIKRDDMRQGGRTIMRLQGNTARISALSFPKCLFPFIRLQAPSSVGYSPYTDARLGAWKPR